MKKQYTKPSIVEYDMQLSGIICSSDHWGYAPAIPGQPTNEHHRA